MSYSIQTRDGITLANIPDDWQPDDARLKKMVAERRQVLRVEQRDRGISELKAQNPGEYDPESADFKARVDPLAGMSTAEKYAANWTAGVRGLGRGLAQLALPKPLERAVGITDESTQEKRALDAPLAASVPGGKAVQIAGEVVPSFAVPGGLISKGLGMLPRVGAGLTAAGVGTRALPTMLAEGATLGGLQGAATPTTSEESVLGNAAVGAVGGAVVPAALSGLGFLTRPASRALQQRSLARKLGEAIDVSPRAQRDLAAKVNQSQSRVVGAPQSLAALTQSPEIASMEIAARAHPETMDSWAHFDQNSGNARWRALANNLGSQASVDAAKAQTDAFANLAIPEAFKRMNSQKLSNGVADFATAVQGRLNNAVRQADPSAQEVYGYVAKALQDGGGSPQMMWNIRKTLSDWLTGTPPPGLQGTRAAKIDRPIMETRKAIDEVLNRASGGKGWTKFLERYGEHARRETEQKAGQNIRNVFFDETLVTPRGATTSGGNPAVTRARLEQALQKFGKNEFGETLNYQQRNVVDQVLDDLRADEILQRAKSSMTGKGGSQTAPLTALMKRGPALSNGWVTDIANAVHSFSQKRQREILNQVLQNPADALTLIRQAERIKRPLSNSEKRLVQLARTMFLTPGAMVLGNSPLNAAPQEVGQ